jgi:plastocyanin
VVQVATGGTFGPAGRVDVGPTTARSWTPTAEEWAELAALSDGSTPFTWRVTTLDETGESFSEPRSFTVAAPSTLVRMPVGANAFEPANIVVEAGSTVTWWNDTVSAGNLQDEPHDVQLVDPDGMVVTHMADLEGGGATTWTFPEPGLWHYLCVRHSGSGTHTDQVVQTTVQHMPEGPYRCMAGTVTVR